MPKHECDPKLELDGYTIQAWFRSLTHENYRHILVQHNLEHLDQSKWYAVKEMLEVVDEIAGHSGGMMDLVAIGMATADASQLPPELLAMPPCQFFQLYDKVYYLHHRGGKAGRVEAQVVDEHHVVMTLNTPYPDDLLYGLFYGYAKRITPPDQHCTVEYDPGQPRVDQGGSATIYHIRWD